MMIQSNDPYYASGMYGQQGTKGRTVLEELTARNVAAILSSDSNTQYWIKLDPRYNGQNFADVVALNAIEFAEATIKQLNLK